MYCQFIKHPKYRSIAEKKELAVTKPQVDVDIQNFNRYS